MLVRQCSNFILLHIAVQFFQHHLLKRMSLPHCIFLPPLSKIRYPQVGCISGFSILFHWFYIFVQILYYLYDCCFVVQSEVRFIPPAPLFIFKVAFAIQGLQCFHENCESFCSSCVKNPIGNLIKIALNLEDCLGQYSHFHNIDSSNLRTGLHLISQLVKNPPAMQETLV